MIKRLEHLAALVVAAGLAIMSYWLFFSWAQGDGSDRRLRQQSGPLQPMRPRTAVVRGARTLKESSETPAGFEQPLFRGGVVEA